LFINGILAIPGASNIGLLIASTVLQAVIGLFLVFKHREIFSYIGVKSTPGAAAVGTSVGATVSQIRSNSRYRATGKRMEKQSKALYAANMKRAAASRSWSELSRERANRARANFRNGGNQRPNIGGFNT
jgi:hypothetical protein